MHRCLATNCAIGLLATINDTKKGWVAYFPYHHEPFGSIIVIEDPGNITGIQISISNGHLPALWILLDCPAEVW